MGKNVSFMFTMVACILIAISASSSAQRPGGGPPPSLCGSCFVFDLKSCADVFGPIINDHLLFTCPPEECEYIGSCQLPSNTRYLSPSGYNTTRAVKRGARDGETGRWMEPADPYTCRYVFRCDDCVYSNISGMNQCSGIQSRSELPQGSYCNGEQTCPGGQ